MRILILVSLLLVVTAQGALNCTIEVPNASGVGPRVDQFLFADPGSVRAPIWWRTFSNTGRGVTYPLIVQGAYASGMCRGCYQVLAHTASVGGTWFRISIRPPERSMPARAYIDYSNVSSYPYEFIIFGRGPANCTVVDSLSR